MSVSYIVYTMFFSCKYIMMCSVITLTPILICISKKFNGVIYYENYFDIKDDY